MALYAILPEFILMHILMAACAVFKVYAGKFLHFYPVTGPYPVTFLAVCIPVFSKQLEPGPAVFKF